MAKLPTIAYKAKAMIQNGLMFVQPSISQPIQMQTRRLTIRKPPNFAGFILLRSENPVSGISETWNNIALIIELFVQTSKINIYIRMMLLNVVNSFLNSNQAYELNVLSSLLFTISMAATALPPVASIGSTTIQIASLTFLGYFSK